MSFFSNNIFPTSKLSYGNVNFNIDGTDKVTIDNTGTNIRSSLTVKDKAFLQM